MLLLLSRLKAMAMAMDPSLLAPEPTHFALELSYSWAFHQILVWSHTPALFLLGVSSLGRRAECTGNSL
jgi:hypothetical protein